MDIEEKVKLIKEVGEEILTEGELRELLKAKEHPVAYDGFEPSGNIHIAQGLLRAINVNKLTKAGIHFKFWVADWFALMNNKLGGDLSKIQEVGKYFIEVWKACGMDMEHVEFLWASEVMDQKYWLTVIRVGMLNTVARVTRCSQIMGRKENECLSAAQIFYPCMQAADIFHLGVDIAQLGMDQRKVNVLAREIAENLGCKKPVAVHHHMLMGLKQPPSQTELSGADRAIALKMSKSDPDSAVFMMDSDEDIQRKFRKAYCPEGAVLDNPILEYFKYIIFEKFPEVVIERPEKFGGRAVFKSYAEFETAFADKQVHPLDLKASASGYISQLLAPVRAHFEKNKHAKELYEKVRSYSVTR